jgi:predicted PurR-regulated permease PerM
MSSTKTVADTKLRRILTDRLGTTALRSLQVIIIVILAAGVIWAGLQLTIVVIPVVLALIVASAFAPIIRFLRKRMGAGLAAWITLLGSVTVLGGLITLIVFAVRGQADELVASAQRGVQQVQQFLATTELPIDQTQINDAIESIKGFFLSSQFAAGAASGLGAAGSFATGLALFVVVLFFFLKDGDRIWSFLLQPFRGERLARGREIGSTTVRTLGDYVRGTATVAFADAFFIGIAAAIMGVPLALPLAVFVFISAFVPIVGATVAGILAALVALVANGPIIALILVGVVILVNQLDGNILQPIIMGGSLKLHPLVILIALTAGTVLGGLVGAILSVPIAAVGWQIVRIIARPTPEQVAAPPKRRRWFGA